MIGMIKAHPEWRLLTEIYKDSNYGTMITHSEIEKVIGYSRKREPEKYYGTVNRWRKEMLKEHYKQIECQITRGYEIIQPDQFRNAATRQLKFGNRRIKKAGEIIIKTPVELLSDGEKRKTGETGIIISQILHFSKATFKKVKQIDKKTDQLLLDVGKALDVAD